MKFEFIDHQSKYLPIVIQLGNKNKKTLGFLPEGGYDEHARKRRIIVAVENNELLGYLLFRTGKRNARISIVHLCVNPEFRGKQIASKLIDQLKEKFQDFSTGIMLSCRKDYIEANRLWEKYGFVCKNEVRSRSVDENYLRKWWYDFNTNNLFSLCEHSNDKIRVVLDANIVIKLRDNEATEYDEVRALFEEWIAEDVDYYFVPEIHNEITRDSNRSRADQTRKFINTHFKEARLNKDESKSIANELKHIISGNTDNDLSDRKQISECIASGVGYFVTADHPILSRRDLIEEKHPISILSPTEFILEIDKINNGNHYHPQRLSGATHTIQKVDNESLDFLIDKFLDKKNSEVKSEFKTIVNSVLQNLNKGEVKTVKTTSNDHLAFWGYFLTNDSFIVPFFRIIDNALSQTLVVQLLNEIINLAIEKKRQLIQINELHLTDGQKELLATLGFSNKENCWKKVAIKDLVESSDLLTKYPILNEYMEEGFFENLKAAPNEELKSTILYKLERKLYPLKFKDLQIPCYIIPIKPYWAGQLFDKFISTYTVFGASADKIWNRENVYYRNVKPVSEKWPARIIWYASSAKNTPRQQSIVAISYLDDVIVDKVKDQFRRFKKYGIYEWPHLYELANKDIENSIKALKFSDTEVLKHPVSFKQITEILLANNRKKNTFTSPLEIDNVVFNQIYQTAVIQYND